MSDKTDLRISILLRESAERFEAHSARIGKILDGAQEKFEKDPSSMIAVLGGALLIGGLALAFWKEQWILSGITIVTGCILVIVAVVIRHVSGVSQIKYARDLVNLERERARFEQRAATLNAIWFDGLPEGTSLQQIQLLLGDSPNLDSPDKKQLGWRKFPTESDDD